MFTQDQIRELDSLEMQVEAMRNRVFTRMASLTPDEQAAVREQVDLADYDEYAEFKRVID